MRRIEQIVLLIICIMFMCACSNSKTSTNDNGRFLGVIEGTEYKTIKNNGYGVTPDEIDIDEKLALDIGNAVIKSRISNIDEHILENTEFVVYEVKDADVFVVSRYHPDTMGGAYNVAISKTDGGITSFWVSE